MAKQNTGGAYDTDKSIDWNLNDVSEGGGCGGGPLHNDSGEGRDVGAVGRDHVVSKRQTGYNKNSGFSQPVDDSGIDFGPADSWSGVDHIDDRAGQTPAWNKESEATAAHGKGNWTDQPIPASAARARKGSAHEYLSSIDDEQANYGGPDGERQ
jgi:hypothetical protein